MLVKTYASALHGIHARTVTIEVDISTGINMSTADIRKEGSAYDLPLAVGILAASGMLPTIKLDQYIMMGELSLDRNLERIKGALPMAINARDEGFRGIIPPK